MANIPSKGLAVAMSVVTYAVIATVCCYVFSVACMLAKFNGRYEEKGPFRTEKHCDVYYNKATILGSTFEVSGARVSFGSELLAEDSVSDPGCEGQPYLDETFFGSIGRLWKQRYTSNGIDWIAEGPKIRTLGWPFRSWISITPRIAGHPAFSLRSGIPLGGSDAWVIPIMPRALPLLGNIIVWGVMLRAVSFGFISWIRARRRRKGMCGRCAYSLIGSQSEICPECGFATRT